MSVTYKSSDLLPVFTAQLVSANGTPIDITASTVTLVMRRRSDGLRKAFVATITTASLGKVSYTWASGDLADVGDYDCEWQVVYTSGSKKLTVPNDSYFLIQVSGAL